MAALQGALSLTEVDYIAVVVGQDLELNVTGIKEQFLQVDISVAEGGLSLAPGGQDQPRHFLQCPGFTYSLPPAASSSFDQQREANFRRDGDEFVVGKVTFTLCAGHNRDTGRGDSRASDSLITHSGYCAGFRTDKYQAGILDRAGKVFPLSQETVARVNGVGSATLGQVDDCIPPKV